MAGGAAGTVKDNAITLVYSLMRRIRMIPRTEQKPDDVPDKYQPW